MILLCFTMTFQKFIQNNIKKKRKTTKKTIKGGKYDFFLFNLKN